jgi:hypothetical protein
MTAAHMVYHVTPALFTIYFCLLFIHFPHFFHTIFIMIFSIFPQRILFVSSLFVFMVFLVGCDSRHKPNDLPLLRSCQFIVTQNNVPLVGADIALISDQADFKWNIGGVTDEKGRLVVKTNGFYAGVPEGTYKITVQKRVEKPAKTGYYYIVSTVDKQYHSPNSTPFTIDINRNGNNRTIDVGESTEVILGGPFQTPSKSDK